MGEKKLQKKEKGGDVIMEYDFNEGGEKKKENPCPEVEVVEKEKKKEEVVVKVEKEKVGEESLPLTENEKSLKKKGKTVKRIKEEREIKKNIEAPVDDVIQSLLDSEKTFVENITRNAKKSPFSSFYPFPKNISFLTIGKKEPVVLVVRHHWVGLMPKAVLAALVFIFPFLISHSVPSWFEGPMESAFFLIGLFIFFMLLSASILLDTFFKWFFEMNVLTTRRIIDVDFVSIMSHRVSETTYDQVQDVSHSPAGPLASVFDYGHLSLQTAGAKSEFEFKNIPRPRDVQDAILDLRELRRKSIAQGN